MFPIDLMTDIEKAFLQLSIVLKNRDYLHFSYQCDKIIQIYRHCRIVLEVACCTYLRNASIKHLLEGDLIGITCFLFRSEFPLTVGTIQTVMPHKDCLLMKMVCKEGISVKVSL